ncbi:histidine phosphatase family protein [Flavobacterium sp. NST-5]|uniref:Histidine phosphatase family protein n=1 Tax=Flavobacterium ichthyis TaxID=2698827 RepID=A0ABW9ZBR1_9FLAO|nr:phosphoglycerate mutase family protein [Flavobacterium ichthyis]NBL65224.1 histidine phosphatase family protein [Flavobacterium ichthyis]
MKTITLIRHAKSSWATQHLDKQRPLSSRGILDAHKIAEEIQLFLPKTFTIYSSTAKRATETAMIFTQIFSCPIESIIFSDDLYTFDHLQLEKFVKSCEDRYDNIILFGHNDAITNFVNKFGNNFIENVPTCGCVSINFEENSWQTIENGKIQKVIFPKDLKYYDSINRV